MVIRKSCISLPLTKFDELHQAADFVAILRIQYDENFLKQKMLNLSILGRIKNQRHQRRLINSIELQSKQRHKILKILHFLHRLNNRLVSGNLDEVPLLLHLSKSQDNLMNITNSLLKCILHEFDKGQQVLVAFRTFIS